MNRLLLLALCALFSSANLSANDFHPEFPLLDASGELVVETGLPMAVMQTCGACHDTQFIKDSSDHLAAGIFEPGEFDCLKCHSDVDVTRDWTAGTMGPDGVPLIRLNIHKPKDQNCAQCHGIVSNKPGHPADDSQ